MTDAQNIASNASPDMSALEIMGASIIFMMLCWQFPSSSRPCWAVHPPCLAATWSPAGPSWLAERSPSGLSA
jgi:hypothetical protein